MGSPEFTRFKKLLKTNGRYVSGPRMRLFGLLQVRPALTLKELIKLTDKHDQATIYRSVKLFERLGIINKLRLGWQTKIELSDIFKHHHHHMSCTNCGKVLVLKDSARLETEIERVGKLAGFLPSDHQIEIRGLCFACQKKLETKKKLSGSPQNSDFVGQNKEAPANNRSLGKPHTSVNS